MQYLYTEKRHSEWDDYVLKYSYVERNFNNNTRFHCLRCKEVTRGRDIYLQNDPIYTDKNCVCPKCGGRFSNPKDDLIDYCGLS